MTSLAAALKEEVGTVARREVRRPPPPRGQGGGAMRTGHRRVEARGSIPRAHPCCIVGHAAARACCALKKTRGRGSPSRRAAKKAGATSASAKPSARNPFSGEVLKAHRERLGLSAENYGKLLGASGLSIYYWEQGKARPRTSSVDAWTAIRRIGKREAAGRLASLKAAEPKSESMQKPAEK